MSIVQTLQQKYCMLDLRETDDSLKFFLSDSCVSKTSLSSLLSQKRMQVDQNARHRRQHELKNKSLLQKQDSVVQANVTKQGGNKD